MVVVKNSIGKNLKVAVGSSAVIGIFYFAFIKGTNHVEYAVLITLVITAIYGAMSLIAFIDRRDKIIIDDVGILLPGKLNEHLPWEDVFSARFYENLGRYQLIILSTKMKQQSFYFFPLDVDLKNFSEFLGKRIDDMRPRLVNAYEEQTEKEFKTLLDSPESASNLEAQQNNDKNLSAEKNVDDVVNDGSVDSDSVVPSRRSKFPVINKALVRAFIKRVVPSNGDSIVPLRFSEYPVINKALIGGFLTSVICFILLLVARLDNPGPMTISMGTGLVYVVLSFFLGTVFWPIFDALLDFRDEFFYGRKPMDPGPLKLEKEKKEKKPVVMQMKKRSRK